jgi:hypothetical protein
MTRALLITLSSSKTGLDYQKQAWIVLQQSNLQQSKELPASSYQRSRTSSEQKAGPMAARML